MIIILGFLIVRTDDTSNKDDFALRAKRHMTGV